MTDFALDDKEIRRKVSGTILADLFDETEVAFAKNFKSRYWATKYAAEAVAAVNEIYYQHAVKLPKSVRGRRN